MNYLAHIYLSGDNPYVQIGNFMGDAVKGRKYESYSTDLKKGILLHRQIDSFTDQHAIVRQSKRRLNSKYGHYAGVLIDIFYDYFLAFNWGDYHKEPLPLFIQDFYTILDQNKNSLPDKIKSMAPMLIQQNWFGNYNNLDGITRVLKGMENRIEKRAPLSDGVQDLMEHHEALYTDFKTFFPLLVTHSKEVLKTLNLKYDESI